MDTNILSQNTVIASTTAGFFGIGVPLTTILSIYVGEVGSLFAVGMVSVAYWLGIMFFSPVWGALADLTGRLQTLLFGSGILATITLIPLAFTQNPWTSISLYWIYAVFIAAFQPLMLTVVSTKGGDHSRGKMIGFFNSARGGGIALGQLLAGVILGLFPRPTVFALLVTLNFSITLLILLLDDPTHSPNRRPTKRELIVDIKSRLLPSVENRSHLYTNGLIWLFVALGFRNMSLLGVFALMPVYITAELGISEFVMGILLASNPAIQIFLMYKFGQISDNFGRKPLIILGMVGTALFALICAVAALLSTVGARIGVIGLAYFVTSVSFSAMLIGALAFIGDVAPPDHVNELMGLRLSAKGFGGVAGPIVIGVLATLWGYQMAFIFAATLAGIASLIVLKLLTESYPRTQTDITNA